MAESLTDAFGIGRDLVSLVGAGGKTTLAFALTEELRRSNRRVVVTTTTRFGADQTGGLPVVAPDERRIAAELEAAGACLVVAGREGHKAIGVSPEWLDELWRAGVADAIVVEADGARRRLVKAPSDHEPVVPQSTTVVIAVMAAAAVGGTIEEVAHRPRLVAGHLGVTTADPLTPEGAAALLSSPDVGRKSVPVGARFVVAITGASGSLEAPARRVASLLRPIPAVLVPVRDTA